MGRASAASDVAAAPSDQGQEGRRARRDGRIIADISPERCVAFRRTGDRAARAARVAPSARPDAPRCTRGRSGAGMPSSTPTRPDAGGSSPGMPSCTPSGRMDPGAVRVRRGPGRGPGHPGDSRRPHDPSAGAPSWSPGGVEDVDGSGSSDRNAFRTAIGSLGAGKPASGTPGPAGGRRRRPAPDRPRPLTGCPARATGCP